MIILVRLEGSFCQKKNIFYYIILFPVADRLKTWVYKLSLAETAGLNLTVGMDISLSFVCYVSSGTGVINRQEKSYRVWHI